jgi:hypothetical protein
LSTPVLELLEEAGDLAEVVREVGIGHHHVAPAGGGQAGHVRVAVAAAALGDHPRAGGGRQLGAAVLGRVVDHDHLAVERVPVEHLARQRDAALDVPLLVQARDDDRDEEQVLAGSRGRGERDGRHYACSRRTPGRA